MAMRPVFVSGFKGNLSRPTSVEFTYFNGFSAAQRKRSSLSLHQAFLREQPNRKVLEVSSFSEEELGIALSAFNLTLTLKNGNQVSVECAFQAGKTFEHGGPYLDLLEGTSKEAKKDPRLKNSGKLKEFYFEGNVFPLIPRTCFYNWLYINALTEHPELADQLMEYDAFTDIVFNPEKQTNCQAEACAYYVSLRKLNLLEEALKSPEDFIRILYLQDFDPSLFRSVFGTTSTRQAVPFGQISSSKSGLHTTNPIGSEKISEPEKPFESTFKTGDKIEHPKFGVGEITNIEVHESSARLTIAFAKETKTLDEKWIAAKCKRI